MFVRPQLSGLCLALSFAILSNGFWSGRAEAQEAPPIEAELGSSSMDTTGDSERAGMALEPPPIQGRRLIFYRDIDYGSESLFNPATVIVSVGLGWYGLLGQDPLLQRIGSDGAQNRLVDAYTHPRDSINDRGGFGDFASSEIILPLLIPVHANSYYHMLGEGMVTRKLDEYYLVRGFSRTSSTTIAITTMFLSQQLNELVEQQSMARTGVNEAKSRRTIDGADSLADTAIWNILGMVSFQFDSFAELFNNQYLNLAFWPGQAAIDIRSGRLFNQGEMYRTALKLPGTDRFKFVWVGGAPFIMGAGFSAGTYRQDMYGATYGLFVNATNAAEIERLRRPDGTLWVQDVTKTHPCVLLHWERNGSLMASFAIRSAKEILLNLYPGAIGFGKWRVGMYADLHAKTPSSIGLTLANLPIIPGIQW